MEPFEQWHVWRRACRFSVKLYRDLAACRDQTFRDGLTRSGLIVATRIAEGAERGSETDLMRCLSLAKGTCGEVRTRLYVGIESGLLPRGSGFALVEEARRIDRMLNSLIESRSGRPLPRLPL